MTANESSTQRGDDEDSDDSMPALEYVGTSPQGAREGLRVGDEVVCEGLSRADLNGQSGTILPFTDAEMARKGRLGVRLRHGDVALKRENLRKVKVVEPSRSIAGGATSSTAVPRCQDRGSVSSTSPLDYKDVRTKSAGASSKAPSAVIDNAADDPESDDNDMPPLEYVGSASKQASSAIQTKKGEAPPFKSVVQSSKLEPGHTFESDDDMPPLEYVGSASKQASSAVHAKQNEALPSGSVAQPSKLESGQADKSDDDMPPLEYVGSASKLGSSIAHSKKNEAPSSESVVQSSKLESGQLGESDDDMPPLEYVGSASKQASGAICTIDREAPPSGAVTQSSKLESGQLDESDDDMPPLEYVGPASKQGASAAQPKKSEAPSFESVVQSAKLESGQLDESDDDMPPLEYVGSASKQGPSAAHSKKSEAPSFESVGQSSKLESGQVDESDDDMPPLQYVGSASKQASGAIYTEKREAPSSQSVFQSSKFESGQVDESDDDMPPLEYVGSASKQQSDAIHTEKSEAPSFESVGLSSKLESGHIDESDDDMPPLEYVGSASKLGSSIAHSKKSEAPSPESVVQPSKFESGHLDDSDDDMPPLEYVGSASKQASGAIHTEKREAHSSQPVFQSSKLESGQLDESDDDMPPLEYVGSASKQGPSAAHSKKSEAPSFESVGQFSKLESGQDDDSDDDMPPLEYVGSASKQGPSAAHSKKSEAPSFESVGHSSKLESGQADDSDDDMTPLEYVGSASKQASGAIHTEKREAHSSQPVFQSSKLESGQLDESDDDMPPLEYVGSASKQAPGACTMMPGAKKVATAVKDDESDDSMPPLDYVGQQPIVKKEAGIEVGVNSHAVHARTNEESDDDMPPLEYVGSSVKDKAQVPSPPVGKVSPPPASSPQDASKNDKRDVTSTNREDDEASDDSMPALEYVGSFSLPALRPGDEVVLEGLSKAELNGRKAVVLPFEDSQMMAKGRLGVRLETGAKLSPKRENLRKATPTIENASDDDDMPPLVHVGGTPPKGRVSADDNNDDDSDEMPVLTNVGKTSPLATCSSKDAPTAKKAIPKASFEVGDHVVLKGLTKKELNGQTGVVERKDAQPQKCDRLPVLMNSSKKTLLIKMDNLEKVEADTLLSDDSMPPLENVCVSKTSQTQKDPSDSDDSLPPLQDSAAIHLQSCLEPGPATNHVSRGRDAAFRIGDVVSLKGLCTLLNGQVGVVTKGSPGSPSKAARFPVKLKSSGKIMLMNGDNLEKLEASIDAEASDDSLPVLESLGSDPSTFVTVTDKSPDVMDADSDDSMPPLNYVGVSRESAAREPNTFLKDGDAGDPETCSSRARSLPADSCKDDVFRVGDAVTLVGLSRSDLNGTRAAVLTKLEGAKLIVKLEESGQRMTVKKDNLQHVVVDPGESDDSMPSLHFVGSESQVATAPAEDPKEVAKVGEDQRSSQENHKLEIDAESDDSMPPLNAVGSVVAETVVHRRDNVAQGTSKRTQSSQNDTAAPKVGNGLFRVGDIVVLRDLADARFNGQRATVLNITRRTHGDRCAIKIISTGQKLAVKPEKLEKLYKDDAGTNAEGMHAKQRQIAAPESVESRAQPSSSSLDLERKTVKKNEASTNSQAKEVIAEMLLERMREALASNSEALISNVLTEVEVAKDLRWGDLLTKKKQIVKKLRAKKRKFEDAVSGVESELPTVRGFDFPERSIHKEQPKCDNRHAGPPPSDSDWQSDKNWVVLTTGSLQDWCASLKLPPEVLERLQSEDVTSPGELAFLPEEDLGSFVKDLKMGPKARFLAAVQSLKRR